MRIRLVLGWVARFGLGLWCARENLRRRSFVHETEPSPGALLSTLAGLAEVDTVRPAIWLAVGCMLASAITF